MARSGIICSASQTLVCFVNTCWYLPTLCFLHNDFYHFMSWAEFSSNQIFSALRWSLFPVGKWKCCLELFLELLCNDIDACIHFETYLFTFSNKLILCSQKHDSTKHMLIFNKDMKLFSDTSARIVILSNLEEFTQLSRQLSKTNTWWLATYDSVLALQLRKIKDF